MIDIIIGMAIVLFGVCAALIVTSDGFSKKLDRWMGLEDEN